MTCGLAEREQASKRGQVPSSAKLKAMQKQAWSWTTHRLPAPGRLARWGHFGAPVLIFPTAGGDFEEIERFQLLAALSELIEGGRMKAYSVDGLSVRASLAGSSRTTCAVAATPASAVAGDPASIYDSFLHEEVLQRIREDCQDPHIEPILAGASRGACVAIATLCRHPDSFHAAVGVSGIYHLIAEPRVGVEDTDANAPSACAGA